MKLSEYRYGREEMLALFDKEMMPTPDLMNLGALFVDKCQFTINLIQVFSNLRILQYPKGPGGS